MEKKERTMTFRFTDSTYERLVRISEEDEVTMTSVVECLVKNEYDSRYGDGKDGL